LTEVDKQRRIQDYMKGLVRDVANIPELLRPVIVPPTVQSDPFETWPIETSILTNGYTTACPRAGVAREHLDLENDSQTELVSECAKARATTLETGVPPSLERSVPNERICVLLGLDNFSLGRYLCW
jgi:hypothetical protein